MANRRFEMFEYRHVIHRMRMGQSDRAIAKSRVMGRVKCGQLREIALHHGWLEDGPLPEDGQIAAIVETVETFAKPPSRLHSTGRVIRKKLP